MRGHPRLGNHRVRRNIAERRAGERHALWPVSQVADAATRPAWRAAGAPPAADLPQDISDTRVFRFVDRRLLRDRCSRHLPSVAAVRAVSRHAQPDYVRSEPGVETFTRRWPLAMTRHSRALKTSRSIFSISVFVSKPSTSTRPPLM
jgi:hypothetical protein